MRILYLFVFLFSILPTFSQTIVFSENFQNGIPPTFTIVDNDGNTPALAVSEYINAWISIQDPDNLADTVAASTSYFTPQDTASRWLITPPIQLGAFGNYFSWEARSHDPSYPDDYLVLVSTTDNQLASFTDTIGFVIEESFDWAYREVDLSDEGYDNQTIYIAFVNKTYDGFKLYLDDFEARKEDVTQVSMHEMNKVIAYPNPATDNISFSSSASIEKITILSAAGTLMLTTANTTIDLSDFPSGIYFARIASNNTVSTIKFIKD